MTRVLHINDFASVDYMNDMVFHGGRTVFGNFYQESDYAWYMYPSARSVKSALYGRGFSITCRLPEPGFDDLTYSSFRRQQMIVEKINSHYFDYIIYGSIRRCSRYLENVLAAYGKSQIAFVDGEDDTAIDFSLAEKGVYFKRELAYDSPHVLPINFSIPKELIVSAPIKTKLYARESIGGGVGYIFDDEEAYYQEYQKSYFGVTYRKAGWDCMRHQEILANYCFPLFTGLEDCPPRTMVLFPKSEIIHFMRASGPKAGKTENYWVLMEQLHLHTMKYLTTDYTIRYILEQLN